MDLRDTRFFTIFLPELLENAGGRQAVPATFSSHVPAAGILPDRLFQTQHRKQRLSINKSD
jgi:hypothetical protein